jgi:hypothetical protein
MEHGNLYHSCTAARHDDVLPAARRDGYVPDRTLMAFQHGDLPA